MTCAEIIKDIMLEQGLTQTSFAEILGVNQTTVSQWILGHKKPSYDNIMAIYKKFGVLPNTLFGLE
jgi:transcriptional regulator with XRE-family HTH domain